MVNSSLFNYLSGDLILEEYDDARSYVDCTWITAHNAFANEEDGWQVFQQKYNLNTLFNQYKVRSFAIDAHYHLGKIALCHELQGQKDRDGECTITTNLLLHREPDLLESWLHGLKKILEENRQEIVTLHFECYVSVQELKQVFIDLELSPYLLLTNPNDQGLTLGTLREKNTRLIVFSDYAYSHQEALVSGIFPTTLYKETSFDVNSIEENLQCVLRDDYRAALGDNNVRLFTFNHFPLLSEGRNYNNDVNKFTFVVSHLESCLKIGLPIPNFIVMDFIDQGEGFSCKGMLDLAIKLNLARKHTLPNFLNESQSSTFKEILHRKLPGKDNQVRNLFLHYAAGMWAIDSFVPLANIGIFTAIDYVASTKAASSKISYNLLSAVKILDSFGIVINAYNIHDTIYFHLAFPLGVGHLADNAFKALPKHFSDYKKEFYYLPKSAFLSCYAAYKLLPYHWIFSVGSMLPLLCKLLYDHHQLPEGRRPQWRDL